MKKLMIFFMSIILTFMCNECFCREIYLKDIGITVDMSDMYSVVVTKDKVPQEYLTASHLSLAEVVTILKNSQIDVIAYTRDFSRSISVGHSYNEAYRELSYFTHQSTEIAQVLNGLKRAVENAGMYEVIDMYTYRRGDENYIYLKTKMNTDQQEYHTIYSNFRGRTNIRFDGCSRNANDTSQEIDMKIMINTVRYDSEYREEVISSDDKILHSSNVNESDLVVAKNNYHSSRDNYRKSRRFGKIILIFILMAVLPVLRFVWRKISSKRK